MTRGGLDPHQPSQRMVAILIPSLYGGGAERVAIRLADWWRTEYRVHIVTLEDGRDYELPPGVKHVVLTRVDGRASALRKMVAASWQLFRLMAYLRRERPDAVVSFLERPVMYVGLLRWGTAAYCVASFRNHESLHLRKGARATLWGRIRLGIYKRLLTFGALRHDHLNFLSEEARSDFFENFIGSHPTATAVPDHSVIYNGYDVDALKALAEQAAPRQIVHWCKDRFVIASMGRLEVQKGHTHLIDVLSRLKAEAGGRYAVLLVGDGSLRKSIKERAASLGLVVADLTEEATDHALRDADIVITGFQGNPFPFIREADCFVFPSLWEGFGNALVEAMAIGQVPLAADCLCGPREVFGLSLDRSSHPKHPDFGYLLPVFPPTGSPEHTAVIEAWVRALSEVATTEAAELDRKRSRARARVAVFSVDCNRTGWARVLGEALKRGV